MLGTLKKFLVRMKKPILIYVCLNLILNTCIPIALAKKNHGITFGSEIEMTNKFDIDESSSDQEFVADQEFAAIQTILGNLSIQLESEDTFSGSIKLQCSNDKVLWHDVKDSAGDVIETDLENNGCILILDAFYTEWVRPVYIGTDEGTATITVHNKG